MHPLAQRYFAMHSEDQKKVQICLCRRALEVWERLVPANLTYRESVLCTKQIFDAKLPRLAFNSVLSGLDNQDLDALYREPLVAMQDDDIRLPKKAEFAYYSIRNLFVAQILCKSIDPWLIVNQALSAIGEDEALAALEDALQYVTQKF